MVTGKGAGPGSWFPDLPVDLSGGRYIVLLEDTPAATYEGGVDGLEATKPEAGEQLDAQAAPVEEYSEYLEGEQADAAASVGAEVEASYTLTLNGFAADLSAEQALELSQRDGVKTLVKDELLKIDAVPSTEFLGLSGPGGVWEATGGAENAGEGVVVGVLDTGIAAENASFAGEPLGTEAGAEPYLEGEEIVFQKSDGGEFRSVCVEGVQFTADDCSTKIVGARYFVTGFGEANIGSPETDNEFLSPRDGDGHGSHTASTAAGNHEVPTTVSGRDFGLISGVAPAAKVAAYKVCWTGNVPGTTDDDGCANSDLLAGMEAATADGVDVINFSIGGGAAQSTVTALDVAFYNAAAAGIFVAASAGNSGPTPVTLDHGAPWMTTVAATTIPTYEGTATFGDGTAIAGASITAPSEEPVTGELVRADLVAVAGFDPADALLCAPNSLDPAKVSGKIVLCQRGVYDRVAKSAEVLRAGGIGTVLVNKTPGSVDNDEHSVPTVHLAHTAWDFAYAYAGSAGATASLLAGNSTSVVTPTPQVAGFSSRGPVEADGSDILKPDISAPGVAILAAGPDIGGTEPTHKFLSGTSMASPHIAGLAALYLGERPDATPAEIKSAMMTTAYDTVDAAGNAFTDPFSQGAGHVDPTKFFEPGLLYLNGPADWAAYVEGLGYGDIEGVDGIDASQLNLASIAIGSLVGSETITRTVTSTAAGEYTWSVDGLAGVDVEVEPATLSFDGPGETATYSVTFTRTDAALDAFSTGYLSWTSGDTVVRSPLAVRPTFVDAPAEVSGTGVTGAASFDVTPGSTGDLDLRTYGLAAGAVLEGEGSDADADVEVPVTIADGVALARFDLDAADDTTDLDLFVYQLDAEGTPIALFQSATGSADERVDIAYPTAGEYVVVIDYYSGSTAWTHTFYQPTYEGGEGAFTTDPEILAAEQGVPSTVTATWTGLQPNTSYLGLVNYSDSSSYTVVTVESGEAPAPEAPVNVEPPTISGTPEVKGTLTADPGVWDTEGLEFAYQWKADGEDIPGATKSTLKVKKAWAGASISVVVTATAGDLPSGTAESAPVVIKQTAKVTVDVSPQVAFSWSRVRATVSVESAGDIAGGEVSIRVGGKTVTAVLDADGEATLRLPRLGSGVYDVKASFAGTDAVSASTSSSKWLLVLF